MGVSGNAPVPEAASQAYLRAKALTLRDGLTLTIDGKPVRAGRTAGVLGVPARCGWPQHHAPRARSHRAPAACEFRRRDVLQVAYRDNNYAERTGWKEIVAAGGTGAAIQNSSVSGSDTSKELTIYPANPTLAPPQETEATFTVAPGGVSSAPVTDDPPPQPQRLEHPHAAGCLHPGRSRGAR